MSGDFGKLDPRAPLAESEGSTYPAGLSPLNDVPHHPSPPAGTEAQPSRPDTVHPKSPALTSTDAPSAYSPKDPLSPTADHPVPAVKICGIRRDEDAAVLNDVLPEYAGFIFHPASRRYIDLDTALHLRAILDQRISCVGVFVDPPLEQVAAVADSGAVQLVQLHGQQNAADIARLRGLVPGVPIIKAVSVSDVASIVRAAGLGADFLLLDGPHSGSGVGFDWALINQARHEVRLPPLFLAGGLTPQTVRLTAGLDIYAVDVSSGVESDGTKDPAKIHAFVAAARRTEGHS